MFRRDLIYAARVLARSRVFAVTAIVTIALGIAASTAMFSVTNAVLLRPLPYRDPDRLVFPCVDMKQRNVRDFFFSNADYFDFRAGAAGAFQDVALVNTFRALFPREDGTPEETRYATVTANIFRVLGARIALGRDFEDADGQPQAPAATAPGAPAPPRIPSAAIISYSFFQRRYGGNPAILGHPLLGAKGGALVVGVLAPGFELLFPPSANLERQPDLWVASRVPYDEPNRLVVTWKAVGRLRPGITLARAQSQADAVAQELRRKSSIWQTAGYQIRVEPMHGYLVSQVRPAILALMGAVVFLLLIACANVANLMLVRASLRRRELAVRTAMGAGWWPLARQMLAEALLIAALGTVLGAALAWLGIHELLGIAPASLPRLDSIAIDPAVLAFAAVTGMLAAALFGVAPALRAARPDIAQVLRAAGRTEGLSGGNRLRNLAVIAEVALSFVLLIGSGLMFRSFIALQHIDPGFDPRGLLTFQIMGAPFGDTPQERAAFMRQLHDRMRAIPGIREATAATTLPLSGGWIGPARWGPAEALTDASKFQATDVMQVQPGYIETLRIPVIAGRTFTDDDNQPDRHTIIIDTTLAAKAFPNESAVGKRFLLRLGKPESEWMQVIGVVAHQHLTSLAEPGREQIFLPDAYRGYRDTMHWALRTEGDPARAAGAVRAELARFQRGMVLAEMQPMSAYVERAQAGTRFSLLLIGIFAIVAVLLAGVGLYGVMATVVRQRTPEIGVRMALGAAPASIFQLVVGQGLRLSVAGIVVGLAAAFALTRVLNSMLVGVKATDPLTFTGMVGVFLVVAAIASWLPARRAAGLDPTSALRDE